MTARIGEQAVLLGRQQSMVGILTRPILPTVSATIPSHDLAVVILNTGIIHRVGHHRMFVALSRLLAGAGHTVLRFDLSGIGDSPPRDDGLPLLESSLADIGEALDWLQANRHISRVVLVGLCSGADHAILYGHTDPRVVALVLMDPSIPPTARHYLHYVAQRLTRVGNWISVAAGRSRLVGELMGEVARVVRPDRASEPVTLQNLRSHEYLERSYRNTVAAGLPMFVVFADESTRQTYRDQMIDAFPKVAFGDLLTLEFFYGSDHLFSRQSDRARLNRLILDWIGTAASRSRRQPSAPEPAQ